MEEERNCIDCFTSCWFNGQQHIIQQDYNLLLGEFKHISNQIDSTYHPEELGEDGFAYVEFVQVQKYIMNSSYTLEKIIEQIHNMMVNFFDTKSFVTSKYSVHNILNELVEDYSIVPYGFIRLMRRCNLLDSLVQCTDNPELVLEELRQYKHENLTKLLDDLSNQRLIFCLSFVVYKIIRDVRCIPPQLIELYDCDWCTFCT
jgi:hypothetical protein